MTIRINRYNVNEIKTLRIQKAGLPKLVEIDVDSILNKDVYPEISNPEDFYDIIELQKILTRLRANKNINITFDIAE